MADLVPAGQSGLDGASPDGLLTRVGSFTAQPAIRRSLPIFGGIAGLGALALAYAIIAPAPQRMLFSELDDNQRAEIAGALDKAAITYRIDNSTGALTVNDDDLYRARMVVASDGALAAPESGIALLDSLPLGASRTMEGERMRAARERELMLTIAEIDGVDAVRVHLAEPQQSVFVREAVSPSASVMLRLAKGRQLSDGQVTAMLHLVANSVTGLAIEDVRIIDQHGRLLTGRSGGDADAVELQARMEEKLRSQLIQLLTPVLGANNFSSEIQVELDMEETTSARETYDKQGAVRQETQEESRTPTGAGAGNAAGVPGVLSNTPPPPTTAEQAPPQGDTPAASAEAAASTAQSRSSRTYELGREVAVSSTSPGQIKRLSVAVALSKAAMKKSKPADIEKIKELISAALGVNADRGDQVTVMVRDFEPVELIQPEFYETSWFASLVRHGVTLLGVLLVLFLGVRPFIKALQRRADAPGKSINSALPAPKGASGNSNSEEFPEAFDRSVLNRQVGSAQKLAAEKPDRAVIALRQMLNQPEAEKS